MAIKPTTALYYANVRFRQFASKHLKTIIWILGPVIAGVSLVASVLQIVGGSPQSYFEVIGHAFTVGFVYFCRYFFVDPRAAVVWLVIFVLVMEVIYQKGQKRFRELALERKVELAQQLPAILAQKPQNHYLGLVIGKMGMKALEIQRRKARDIISAIDKNIKKREAVYWISVTEIGIIMYEIEGRDEKPFVKVISDKLVKELGPGGDAEREAKAFVEDIKFAMIRIESGDELEDIELKARNELERGVATETKL